MNLSNDGFDASNSLYPCAVGMFPGSSHSSVDNIGMLSTLYRNICAPDTLKNNSLLSTDCITSDIGMLPACFDESFFSSSISDVCLFLMNEMQSGRNKEMNCLPMGGMDRGIFADEDDMEVVGSVEVGEEEEDEMEEEEEETG